MKKIFRAFLMCFTMFTAIPCPFHVWDEESRPLMTLCLPVVGLILGAVWTGILFLLRLVLAPALVAGAVLTAYPVLVTGFMHMDGFLDVTDAVKSWRDLDERRRILKDPHAGSFAVIACVLLIVTEFALLSSLKPEADPFALLLIPAASRALSGFFVTVLRPISVSEYAGTYQKGVKKGHAVWFAVFFAVLTAAGFLLLGKYGFVPVGVLAGYLPALRRAFKSLDGMSGDVSGYALCFGELAGIAVFALI